jgi:hypothetical protein
MARLDSCKTVWERLRICENFLAVLALRNKEIRTFSVSGRVSKGNVFMICKSNKIPN